jgi:hypothetical protein
MPTLAIAHSPHRHHSSSRDAGNFLLSDHVKDVEWSSTSSHLSDRELAVRRHSPEVSYRDAGFIDRAWGMGLAKRPQRVCASPGASTRVGWHTVMCACGCGAVVAHHLAKVRVASSNLVIRSVKLRGGASQTVVVWPRGEAAACKAVYTGSNPVATSVEIRDRKIGRLAQR